MSRPEHADEINAPARASHDCESCTDCLHEGNECCGCYDRACCQPPCVCGVPIWSDECKARAHLRGPHPWVTLTGEVTD